MLTELKCRFEKALRFFYSLFIVLQGYVGVHRLTESNPSPSQVAETLVSGLFITKI